MKIKLNVNNMVAKMRQARNQEDLEEIHDTFYKMYNLDFITHEEWKKFTKIIDDWVFDENDRLVDFETGEPID